MTIMQLAGFPAEVVDSVVSVLCRMAFEFGLWSDGAAPLLFVCEEAHRYAPADRSIGFGPTRKAISRIAKEGRKYGVFLGLITQRPAEREGVALPTRLKFKELPEDLIPRSEAIGRVRMDAQQAVDAEFIASVVHRWRGAMMSQKAMADEQDPLDMLAAEEFTRLQPSAVSGPQMPSPPKVNAVGPESFAFPTPQVQGQELRGLRK
jgi:hypothetical protein